MLNRVNVAAGSEGDARVAQGFCGEGVSSVGKRGKLLCCSSARAEVWDSMRSQSTLAFSLGFFLTGEELNVSSLCLCWVLVD